MKKAPALMAKRLSCVSLLASALLLALPGVSHAQAPLQEITYLLPAPGTLPAFGPWMLAQAKGYYKAEGLDVKFVAARGGVDVAKQVGAGNAVIGGAIGDTPIIARAQGIPVKAVAVLGSGSLTQLVSHKDERIESPRELKGKTVTVISYTDTTYYALLGMLSKVGLTKNDVNIQAAGPAGVWQQFAAKKAVAMAGVPDWTSSAMEAGAQVDILPADVYFKSMAQAILASDETIQKNPQLIQKLVRATLKGMKDIMANPKDAAIAYVQQQVTLYGIKANIAQIEAAIEAAVYSELTKQPLPAPVDATMS